MSLFSARLKPSRNRGSDFTPGGPASGGFTLVELLIVISVVLLVTLIAVPNLPWMRIQANENSAIASVRSIYKAETDYAARYPANGFACSLSQLGGRAGLAAASPEQAQVLPNDLAGGRKSGYVFTIVNCGKRLGKDTEDRTSFEIKAVPQVLGKTGHRGFCEDAQGEPRADPTGGTNCTLSLQ
jgi:type IV pilus assembly protein PilA